MKIQLETGSSSSATHSLTSPSRTIDRRAVSRPAHLAIEEAAARTNRTASGADTPSRLVNLRVHDADLVAAKANLAAQTLKPASTSKALEPAPKPKVLEPVPEPKVIAPVPAPKVIEPASEPKALESATERALAINIAADYTAASLDATMADLPARIEQRDKLAAAIYEAQNTPIDAIARTASEAIASIRAATDPDDIATQISALKKFATNIQNNADFPEMSELANTINKFIAIAEKSTGVKTAKTIKAAQAAKSVAVKPVAASKVQATKPAAGTAIKVNAKPVAKASTAKSTAQASAAKTTAQASAAKAAPKSLRHAKPLKAAKPKRHSQAISSDAALEKALRSVASMEKDERPAPAQKVKTRKKGRVGRFMLALGCATACVAAIIYVVGTNIPDISVRVAALQTGVEASYPSYIPRDFSLKGINSENGKITLTFVGPDNASFTLIEEKSSWDSAALERNYVKPTWDDTYTTTHEQGITIYMYGANAAWVNGGVLYKINSDSSSLTKKQLRNIVISMQ